MYGLVVIRSSAHASIGAERQKQGGGGKKRRQASETLRHLSPHNFGGGDGGGGGYVYYLWAVVVWYPLGFVENVPSMNWRSVARLKALICPISNLQTFAEDSLLLGLGGRGVGWGRGEFAWFFPLSFFSTSRNVLLPPLVVNRAGKSSPPGICALGRDLGFFSGYFINMQAKFLRF